MACQKRHNNLDSLKRSLVKTAAEIPMETVQAVIAEWPKCQRLALGQRVAILSAIIINKNLNLLLINYLAQKVDVLFHFPSRSQNPCNRTYGKTMLVTFQRSLILQSSKQRFLLSVMQPASPWCLHPQKHSYIATQQMANLITLHVQIKCSPP